jgi:hypothetical protein
MALYGSNWKKKRLGGGHKRRQASAVPAAGTAEPRRPHCSRGVQPGGICVNACAMWCSASRPPEARGRAGDVQATSAP